MLPRLLDDAEVAQWFALARRPLAASFLRDPDHLARQQMAVAAMRKPQVERALKQVASGDQKQQQAQQAQQQAQQQQAQQQQQRACIEQAQCPR